jgi:hypothetical protein
MNDKAKQKFAGLFRRGIPEGDQLMLLVGGVVTLLVEQHGKKGAVKLLNVALESLSKPPQP